MKYIKLYSLTIFHLNKFNKLLNLIDENIVYLLVIKIQFVEVPTKYF